MDEPAAYISIAEAATLLGVHRNTVRNRIKVGRYKARKVVTPQGETYAIARDSLGTPAQSPTNEPLQPLSGPVRHNAPNPSQPGSLINTEQQAQADAIVQRLLAPFIAELGAVREELGRVKAERDAKDEALAELRRRAEAAEAQLEQLTAGERAVETAPVAPGAPVPREPSIAAPTPSAGLWQRFRAAVLGH